MTIAIPAAPSGDDDGNGNEYPGGECRDKFKHMSMHEMLLTGLYMMLDTTKPEQRALRQAIREKYLSPEMGGDVGCLHD